MAPARSTRRAHSQNAPPPPSDPQHAGLFLEPMMGTPLAIYIEKDVDDRDGLVDLITVRTALAHRSPGPIIGPSQKHGGAVSPSYSGTPYILGKCASISPNPPTLIHASVDPHKESGQNLFRQYAGKKGKIVLHSRWVLECVRIGALQTFQNNWAGCKVTGTEK